MNHMLSTPAGATEHNLSTQSEKVWREWEEMIELVRILIARPELWDTQFCCGISSVLSPAERLSLPWGPGSSCVDGGRRDA